MERLTKRISGYAHGAEGRSKDNLTGNYCRGEFEATACIEKLADYEDLEEQGLLLKLPCKVGDTVYTIYSDEDGSFVKESIVEEVSTYSIWIESMYFDHPDLGKTVFLTRAEAEEALRKMNGMEE